MTIHVVAAGAVSPLGVGSAAYEPGALGEPARSVVRHQPALEHAGLRKPFAARVEQPLATDATRDRAGALLSLALGSLEHDLSRALPSWRERRVGLCVGTSGGGMPSLMEHVSRRESGEETPAALASRVPYFGPLAVLPSALSVRCDPVVQVLAACASSTFALGIAKRWLELGIVDLAIAGGYDALSEFIAAGFECLGATAAAPLPFRVARSGLALGEGAALVALVDDEGLGAARSRGVILGFGAASDAVHVTAPDRNGAGLVAAAEAALADAGVAASAVRLVSAHGTATPYNDLAESKALGRVLGPGSHAVVHPFKAVIGHTLGAAGALESLSAFTAMERRVLPATPGDGEVEPELTLRLLSRAEAGDASPCLKLSSAFGGANAALVLASPAGGVPRRERRAPRPVTVLAVGEPATVARPERLVGHVSTDAVKLSRMDPVSSLAVAAALAVHERVALASDAAVVVGTATATLDIDFDFERRRRARGPEPRRFPGTSPNLAPGECSIAFGLLGPSLSVGAGPAAALEALLVGHDLVAAGDADTVLVVAVEHVSEEVGALWARAGWPRPAAGAVGVLLGCDGGVPLPRAAAAAAWEAARAGVGCYAGAQPGWPALLAFLRTFGASSP